VNANRGRPSPAVVLPEAAEPGLAARPLARGSRIQTTSFWNTQRHFCLLFGLESVIAGRSVANSGGDTALSVEVCAQVAGVMAISNIPENHDMR
jgi:hypothetical protein